jgi:hypothetical protein
MYASCIHAYAYVYIQTGRKHAAFPGTVRSHMDMYVCICASCIYVHKYIHIFTLARVASSAAVRKLSTLNIETERVAAVTGFKHTLTTDSDSDALIA